MTEDDRDKGKEEVQSLLKQYEDKISDMSEKKEKEVMEQ
jgi:ribosome recycling factor